MQIDHVKLISSHYPDMFIGTQNSLSYWRFLEVLTTYNCSHYNLHIPAINSV